jgi:transposase
LDPERRIAELEAELAASYARIAEQAAQIEALIRQVAALTERIARNSGNSNLPPSSDSPSERANRNKGKSGKGKRRGGQPGHRGSRRELLAVDHVDDIVDFFPDHCEHCSRTLPKTPDPHAKRYQFTELPAFEPHTTEYRRHRVQCLCCGKTTRAAYDAQKIPSSPFGPRLMSAVALLTGVYHLSRRRTVELLSDLVGVRISLGAVSRVEERVSEAVAPTFEEAHEHVVRAGVKHTDGTTWLQAGVLVSLWTIATACATLFKIVRNGRTETLRPLYGKPRGILISDRAAALNFWAMERRQICWAHLMRKFIAFEERNGKASELGRELLQYTSLVFEYWSDFREGRLSREELRAWIAPVREQFEALLQRAVDAKLVEISGSCADMLDHRAALWNFVEHEGVDPTNNHAERELRAFVLWRKRSYGTQSERGNRFAERLMTLAHTARKQRKNVLELLTACCVADLDDSACPSLFERPRAVA